MATTPSVPDAGELQHAMQTLPSGIVQHTWAVPNAQAIVVLQHGFAEYAERFVTAYMQLVVRLNALRIDVVALDMPGHGRSSGRRSVFSLHEGIAAHVTLLRELTARDLPIVLFGHSLGGLVTVGSVVQSQVPLLRGVVLSGPAFFPPLGRLERMSLAVGMRLSPGAQIPVPKQPVTGLSRLDDEVRKASTDPMIFHGVVSFQVVATAMEALETVRQRLGEWTVPTLVVHGADDKFTDPKQSELFVQGIRSEDKKMHLEPEGRHELLNDTCREEMLKLILDWIQAHL